MPISAIETGCVGFVLRPNEIARELTRLSRYAVPLAGVAHSALVSMTQRDSAEAMALQARS
jgi:hypothetical protein